MEALGESSMREAPHTGWSQDAPGGHTVHTQPPSGVAQAGNRPRLVRWLASLNADKVFSDLFFIAETCTICVLAAVTAVISLDTPLSFWNLMQPQGVPYLLVPAGAAIMLKAKGLYEFEQLAAFFSSIAQVLLCVALAFGFAVLIGYGLEPGGSFSGILLATWLLSTLLGLMALRACGSWICARLIRAGAIQKTFAVFGDASVLQGAVGSLRKANKFIRLAGIFSPRGASGTSGSVAGHPFEGDIEALIKGARADAYDTIVIATDNPSSGEIGRLLARLETLPCAVQLCFTFKNGSPRSSGQTLALFDVQARPISGWGLLSKRCLDVCLAAAGMIFLAPFLLFVAAAIKLDSPGPVFFTQRRHGLNRKIFKIFKLRTMSVMEDGEHAVQAGRKDARVTRVGALLRKTSVDELPQLLNVLKGDMSLVGPRPHPLSLDNYYAGRLHIYSGRHKVKPGITGWAQIHGHRGPTDQPGLMQSRVQHDLEYIDAWSFWLDMKILAATPFLGFIHKNAV